MAFNRRLRKVAMLILAATLITILSSNGAANDITQNRSPVDKLGFIIPRDGAIVSQFEMVPFSIDRFSIGQSAIDPEFPLIDKETFVSGVIGELPRFFEQSENDGIYWLNQIGIRQAFPGAVSRFTELSIREKIGAIDGGPSVSPRNSQTASIPSATPIYSAKGRPVLIQALAREANEINIGEPRSFTSRLLITGVHIPIVTIVPIERRIGMVPKVNESTESVIPSLFQIPPLVQSINDNACGPVPSNIADDIAAPQAAGAINPEAEVIEPVSNIHEKISCLPIEANTTGEAAEISPTDFDLISFIVNLENIPSSWLIAEPPLRPHGKNRGRNQRIGNDQIGVGRPVRDPDSVVGDSPCGSTPRPFIPSDSVRYTVAVNCVQSNERGKVHQQTQRKIAAISFVLNPLTRSCSLPKNGGSYDLLRSSVKPRAPADGQRVV